MCDGMEQALYHAGLDQQIQGGRGNCDQPVARVNEKLKFKNKI